MALLLGYSSKQDTSQNAVFPSFRIWTVLFAESTLPRLMIFQWNAGKQAPMPKTVDLVPGFGKKVGP